MRMKNLFILEKNSNLSYTKMTLRGYLILIGVCIIVIACSTPKEKVLVITQTEYDVADSSESCLLHHIILTPDRDTLLKQVAILRLKPNTKDTTLEATFRYYYHNGKLKSIERDLDALPPVKIHEFDYLFDTVFITTLGGQVKKKYKDTFVYGSPGESYYRKGIERENEDYTLYLKSENGILVNEIISQHLYDEKKQLVKRTQMAYNLKREVVYGEIVDFEYEKGLVVTINHLNLSRQEDDKPVLDSGLFTYHIRYNKQKQPVEFDYSIWGKKNATINYTYDREGKLTKRMVLFTQGYTFFSQFAQRRAARTPFEFEPINASEYFFDPNFKTCPCLGYFTEEPTVLDMSYTYSGDEISDIILKIRDTIRIHKKIRYLDKPLILH